MRDNPEIRESYLGLNEAGARRSYREVKRSRRRQRWLA
jgi:branched-chain amino acid transport system ATP-binding protein